MTNLKKRTEGFTIIEVMIVLVIAAVILLIVFLAVPALQRNSRNTQRRNDVAQLSSAVTEFTNNNSGKLPTTATNVTTINGLAKPGILTNGLKSEVVPIGAKANAIVINDNTAELVTGAKCADGTGGTVIGNAVVGPARSFVILYAVENSSGGAIPQCQESGA